jgi:CRP-like cAMP-binding protein
MSSSASLLPTKNRLLLALPRREFGRLTPTLEHVKYNREEVLVDADSSLDYIYFPDSGVISIVAVYPDGSIIEMATIGREGATGFQAVFGAKMSSARFFVQLPGTAVRMSRVAFQRAMQQLPSFRALMFAHVHAFLEQVLVSAACNGAHSVSQRLARWLLMMRDRHDEDTLPITQDLLAEMLGVHRPTVTNAVRALHRARLIEVSRKRVAILHRDGLMKASCECYQLVRLRIAHHLPKTYVE